MNLGMCLAEFRKIFTWGILLFLLSYLGKKTQEQKTSALKGPLLVSAVKHVLKLQGTNP